MKIILLSTLTLVITTLIFFSCTKDKVDIVINPNCIDTIYYTTQVEPILNQSCATSNCHDAMTSAAGYDFTNHANVSDNANRILSVIRHENGYLPMPTDTPKLSDSIAQQIECWILQGTLNN